MFDQLGVTSGGVMPDKDSVGTRARGYTGGAPFRGAGPCHGASSCTGAVRGASARWISMMQEAARNFS